MAGQLQAERAQAQLKADRGGVDQRAAPRLSERGRVEPDSVSDALNEGPQSQSLLRMRQAFDESPRVQSQLALQRALNRTRALEANEGEQPEQEARSEPAQLAAMPGDTGKPDDPPSTPVQKKPNATGMPDHLKAGVESLSGLPMDDVRVHFNSPKPAAVQAHAYAQGTDIHLAPGQEKHLAHEAWHVVQQKQGRVKPTLQAKGVAINDDEGLEREASRLGRAASLSRPLARGRQQPIAKGSTKIVQKADRPREEKEREEKVHEGGEDVHEEKEQFPNLSYHDIDWEENAEWSDVKIANEEDSDDEGSETKTTGIWSQSWVRTNVTREILNIINQDTTALVVGDIREFSFTLENVRFIVRLYMDRRHPPVHIVSCRHQNLRSPPPSPQPPRSGQPLWVPPPLEDDPDLPSPPPGFPEAR
jgi:hypothetical protein